MFRNKCVSKILCAHLLSTISGTCTIYMVYVNTNVSLISCVLIYYLLSTLSTHLIYVNKNLLRID